MAMKKGAKIGLGIFIGFVSVIVILVATAAIILFGGRDFKPGEFTAEDKQAVVQKLPVMDKLEQLKNDNEGKQVIYTDPEQGQVELDQGQMNALISSNNPVDNIFGGSKQNTEQSSTPKLDVEGTAIKIEDDQLEIKMKLGETNVTNNVTVDDFLNGSVAIGKFEAVDGKAVLIEFQLNNLGANMIPGFVLDALPDYNGEGMVEYINTYYSDSIQEAFEDLFAAQKIDSITIQDSQIKVEGAFYQDAYVE